MPILDKHAKGVLFGLAAFFCYSGMDIMIKLMTRTNSVTLTIFLQSGTIIAILLLHDLWKRDFSSLRSANPRLQLTRGCLHIVSGWSAYFSFTQIPLANFYTVGFLAPLVIALLAWAVYRERPTRRTWTALALGFMGMLVIVRPDTLPLNEGSALAFVWIVMGAVNVMFVRQLPKDHPDTFIVYSHALLVLTAAYFAIPQLPAFDWYNYTYAFGGAVCAVVAGKLFYGAYRLAPAALVAPTQYTQLIWGALAGWFVFDSHLTVYLFIGALFIIAAGLLVVTQTRGNPIPPSAARRLSRVE